jgi:type II secretory pathway pseudopilin PulG
MARRARGFTLIDVTAAMAVVSVVAVLVIQALASSHQAARGAAELRLASGVAQGAFERLRSLPPEELVSGQDGVSARIKLPPEATDLREAALTATVAPWQGDGKLRHLRVVLTWQSWRGHRREVVREGLSSDERIR